MKLNDADKIYIGGAEASAVYAGAVKVWEMAAAGPTQQMVVTYNPTTPRNDFIGGEVGFVFIMGSSQTFSFIGLYCYSSSGGTSPNTGLHTVNLYLRNAGSEPTLLRTGAIDMTGKPVYAWAWTAIAPITLSAGQEYSLLRVANQYWPESSSHTLKSYVASSGSAYRGGGGSGPINQNGGNDQYGGSSLGW